MCDQVNAFQDIYASTTLQLLRMDTDTGPLACAFLSSIKEHEAKTGKLIYYAEALTLLEEIVKNNSAHFPEPPKPAQLLAIWAGTTRPLLLKKGTGPDWQLANPYAVRQSLDFILQLSQQDTIATETTYHQILDTLNRLTHGTEDDIAIRKAQLEEDKKKIEALILRLEAGEAPAALSPLQVQEHIDQLQNLVERILTDFEGVKERLNEVSHNVLMGIQDEDKETVSLLSKAFSDARTLIKETRQGQSYEAFQRAYTRAGADDFRHILEKLEKKNLPGMDLLRGKFDRIHSITSEIREIVFDVAQQMHKVLTVRNQQFSGLVRSELAEVAKLLQTSKARKPLPVSWQKAILSSKPTVSALWVPHIRDIEAEESIFAEDSVERTNGTLRDQMSPRMRHYEQFIQNAKERANQLTKPTLIEELLSGAPPESALEILPYWHLTTETDKHKVCDGRSIIHGKTQKYSAPRIILHAK